MNRRTILLIAAAGSLALAGCATLPPAQPAASAGEAYFALGTEPFWSLEITPARLAYNNADGANVAVPNPGARAGFNGERYVTDRITVDITRRPCSDGMSDRRYADTVRVTVDGQDLSGCGGDILPPAALDGTQWRIVSIDDRPVVAGAEANLAFANGQISGTAGCNRLAGGFASDGNRLTVSQAAVTRMMCRPELMAQETRLLELLRQSLAMRFDARGRMILTGDGDARILLERAI